MFLNVIIVESNIKVSLLRKKKQQQQQQQNNQKKQEEKTITYRA